MSLRRPPPIIAIAAILCAAVIYAADAQAPAPAPSGLDCMTPLLNLSDCLSYVVVGSKDKKPDKACCPELAGLVDSNPICLCELLGGAAASYGINVDTARALGLPKVCHVETPPVSLCSEIGIPVSAPLSALPPPPPTPAPSPGFDCLTPILNLSDCLPYVVVGSKDKKPDKDCCPELAGLVDSNPICLCELLGGAAASYGINIDNARALGLPKICHVETPPVSLCSAIGIPVSAPLSGIPAPSPASLASMPAASSPATTSPPSDGNRSFNSVDLIVVMAISYIVAFIGIF